MILVKLGGSLITDKLGVKAYKPGVVVQLGQQIAEAINDDPTLRLVIGHGSGSFGHVSASKYNTINGVTSPEEWRGFAEVALAAAELNHYVAVTLAEQGVPVFRVSPSASVKTRHGVIQHMALDPLFAALMHGLVPLVHGDVAIDEVIGGTIISTEAVLDFLARHLPVRKLILLGDEQGVYDTAGKVIPVITPSILPEIQGALGGSKGADVTGGMVTKVTEMLKLVTAFPGTEIVIACGTTEHLLYKALRMEDVTGTVLRADAI